MKIIVEGNSHINDRSENQDVINSAVNLSNNHLFLLADGMGGHTNGRFCANFFSENLVKAFEQTSNANWNDGIPFQWVERTLHKLRQELHEYVLNNNISDDMGTTMVGVILIKWTLFCFNIGDSRCYVINSKNIKQITMDQVIGSYPELKHLGNPVYLTSALGPTKETMLDFSYLTINEHMKILLTSDGIHGIIDDSRIHEIIMNENSSLKVRVQILVNEARIMGGKDNASCLALEFK